MNDFSLALAPNRVILSFGSSGQLLPCIHIHRYTWWRRAFFFCSGEGGGCGKEGRRKVIGEMNPGDH